MSEAGEAASGAAGAGADGEEAKEEVSNLLQLFSEITIFKVIIRS